MAFGSQINAALGAQAALVIGGDVGTYSGAGTTQGTATAITTPIAIFTTTGFGTGGILPVTPTVSANDRVHAANHGENTLAIYPPSGGKLSNKTANMPAMIPPNKCADFVCIDGTNWSALLGA